MFGAVTVRTSFTKLGIRGPWFNFLFGQHYTFRLSCKNAFGLIKVIGIK